MVTYTILYIVSKSIPHMVTGMSVKQLFPCLKHNPVHTLYSLQQIRIYLMSVFLMSPAVHVK